MPCVLFKCQTFCNNITDGSPLRSVGFTQKIALTFRPIGCPDDHIVLNCIFIFSQQIQSNAAKFRICKFDFPTLSVVISVAQICCCTNMLLQKYVVAATSKPISEGVSHWSTMVPIILICVIVVIVGSIAITWYMQCRRRHHLRAVPRPPRRVGRHLQTISHQLGKHHTARFSRSPVSGSPADGSPVSGSPADGSPVSGSPVSGSPVSGSPADGSPVSGSPVVGSHVSL